MRTLSVLFILSNFSSPSKLWAQDSFGNIYNFTEDIRSVVVKSPSGNPMPDHNFHLSTTQADQMKALVRLDSLTAAHVESEASKKDCDKNPRANSNEQTLEKKISQRDIEIYVSAISSDYKFEQESLSRYMADDYINYMGKIASKNPKAYDIYSISSLENKFNKTNPQIDLSKLSFKEKEKLLSEYANKYLGEKLPDGLIMKEMAFNYMVDHSSSWKEVLAAANEKLSNQQKIELVSKVGGTFGNRYNYTRFNEGDSASGYVTIEKLFDSIKNGTEGGICRDIALAQTQMLRELGFKNNYVVTYKTLGGYHSNVISTDPETGKVVKFNYADTSLMKKGSGVEALIQDTTMPDHGLGFRIHDADGKPVTQVSSELGNMLKDTTGGEMRAFTDINYSLAKVGVKFGSLDGNLFTGKTSTGENIYGVAIFKKYDSEFLSLNGGVSLSKIAGDRTYVKMDQENLYARLGAEVRTPRLEAGPLSIGGFIGGGGEVLAYNARESSTSSNYTKSATHELDAKAEGYVGVRSDLNLSSAMTITNKTYMTYYPDLANVAVAGRIKGVTDAVYIESGMVHKFSETDALLIDTTIALKNYGTSMGAKIAYEDYQNNLRVRAGYETPLTKDIPSFLPGASTHAYAGIDKETKSGITFSLEYDRNFSNGSNSFFLKASKKF